VIDAGSAVVNFSAEGLGKLGEVAQSGWQSASDAIDSAEHSVVDLYNEVADMAQHGVDAVDNAATSVVDGVKSAAQTAAKYVGLGEDASTQSVQA
jgi:phage-related protein